MIGRRWKILIGVGLSVAVLDQWTKYLAVKHLTPGLAIAHRGMSLVTNPEERARALEEVGWAEGLGHFYGGIERPCDGPMVRYCPTVRVIDGFWNWRYVENPGAAWGLLSTASDSFRVPFFLVVSLGALAFIIAFFRRLDDRQLLLPIALSLVFGGAIGNFIDRLHLSYVIDFIDWYVGKAHWPTFNVADAAITSGVSLLVIEWVRDWRRARSRRDEPVPAEST